MKTVFKISNVIFNYLQTTDVLPSPQLRRLGLIYSSYRLIISLFFMLLSYATAKTNSELLLPSLLQQAALGFYFLLSFILLGLFYVIPRYSHRQLAFGLAIDVFVLSLLLYANGAPDLQLTMLYMVVVAASFMLLRGSQALIITLLAIIFVIYQQFFHAIANSFSLANVGDAVLISASFLAVGFLSWSVSQRLVHVEQMASQQAHEVERLNTINQEVISQMLNGVMVMDQGRIVLANAASYQLLDIDNKSAKSPTVTEKVDKNIGFMRRASTKFFGDDNQDPMHLETHALSHFNQQLKTCHPLLLSRSQAVAAGASYDFVYELPTTTSASVIDKIRVQIIPLQDNSKLLLLADLRREQAHAQQLKLASLGQLTASIAHEIRNPLAAISQASQLLIEEALSHDEIATNATPALNELIDDNHELHKMIFTQTKRVNRIIEDVLKLSRQQPPQQQQIDLTAWMSQFLDNYFGSHDVFLRSHVQPTIHFDAQQLEQILINLINNGLRYSGKAHPHAYVEVEIYCTQNDVIIDVLDDGNGVDESNQTLLFDPFFTTDKAGTGLGLYLSQSFSDANRARLVYVAKHEKTCFRLIIPATSYPADINSDYL